MTTPASSPLRAAGLYDGSAASCTRRRGDAHPRPTRGTSGVAEDGGEDAGRPEVNRRSLRDLLLDSLPDGMVRWGAKVTGARRSAPAVTRSRLADGSTFTTDLLIGADGAWSRVRPLVSDAMP